MSSTIQDRLRQDGVELAPDVRVHSVEAEQAVIGSELLGATLQVRLVPDDFYCADHRVIQAAIDALKRASTPIDVIMVSQELERSRKLEDAGGLANLSRLASDTIVVPANVDAYARKVLEYSQLRRLLGLGPEIARAIGERVSPPDIARSLQPVLEEFVQNAAPQSKLKTLDFSHMRPHVDDAYLVKGLFQRGTLIGINGVSGSGKTFFATDLAMHLAANQVWRGLRVQGGSVVYSALEGPASAENRFVAGRLYRDFATTLPLRLTPGPLNLRDASDVLDLIAVAKEAQSDFGQSCVAVFVDTLSRAMSGGDENGPEDMGALIRGADAVHLATGAAVFLIHHLGKDESRGARGHSSLKGALDTEIEVTAKDNIRLAIVTKQRDLPTGGQYAFALKVVELGRDDEGDPVTSCIVQAADYQAKPNRKEPTGKLQKRLLTALKEWKRRNPNLDLISSVELRDMAKTQDISKKSTLDDAVDGLQKLGWLFPCAGGFRFHSQDIL